MMRVLITGAAGFIGSHLSSALLHEGHDVIGIDSFTSYYDPQIKRRNLAAVGTSMRFDFRELDISRVSTDDLLNGVEVVFHLAGQPGVRASWGSDFAEYLERNVSVTQRLLESARRTPSLRAFVNASSSSVYGNQEVNLLTEDLMPRPISPYGVSKLAAEHLATLYALELGLPTVSLRYFTVYGPRQRPDMGIHRLIESAKHRSVFVVNGDGSQRRDFTFVGDIVTAHLRVVDALLSGDLRPGSVFNVGSGKPISLIDLISTIEKLTGVNLRVEYGAALPGDPLETFASIERITSETSWTPEVTLLDGLSRQIEASYFV